MPMTDVTIKDRIVAHRSAPDVYDPPTFEQMADRIEELEAKLAKLVEALKDIRDVARVSDGVEFYAMLSEKALVGVGIDE